MKNEERPQHQATARSRTVATTVLMVATFMDLMDSTITNVALPTIGKDLHATPEQLEWTLAGYVIAFATLLITGGRLGDIFGHRRIFVIGIVGFTLASLGAALSQTGDLLVATRVIQGAFAGIMVPQVLSSVQVMFAPEERAPVLGIIGALSSLGAVGGLILGGWLVTADLLGMGWRSIFLVNVPVGVVLVAAALLFVPRSRSEHPLRPDLAGVLLGGLVQAAALTWVLWTIWTAGASLTGWDLTAPLALTGAGLMTLIMPLTSITLESVPTQDAGAASGTLTTFGQIGMVLGVALAGAVFFGILQDTADARDAVTTALRVPIVAYGLAGIASVTMPDPAKALPQDV